MALENGSGAGGTNPSATSVAAAQKVASALLNTIARQAIIAAAADAVSQLDRAGYSLSAADKGGTRGHTGGIDGGGKDDPPPDPNTGPG